MIGYKGIEYRNGILRAKSNGDSPGDIFEINIPKQKVRVVGGPGFTEIGYSFCDSIEGVLNWEEYIDTLLEKQSVRDIRLFEIDTLDTKTVGSGNHIKAEQIVVKREIVQSEIIQYFSKRPRLLDQKILEGRIRKEIWEKYCSEKIEDYEVILEERKIAEIPVKNCFRLHTRICQQSDELLFENCKNCEGKTWKRDAYDHLNDYLYLQSRRKLYEGMQLKDIKEYKLLEGCSIEQESLRLLEKYSIKGTGRI